MKKLIAVLAIVALFGFAGIAEASMVMRLDAAPLTTAGDLATWSDTSGNSNDAVSSGATDPSVVLGVLNSLPVVRFAPVSPSVGGEWYTVGDVLGATGASIFIVTKQDVMDGSGFMQWKSWGQSADYYNFAKGNTCYSYFGSSSRQDAIGTGGRDLDASWNIVNYTATAGSWKAYFDGDNTYSAGNTYSTGTTTHTIGAISNNQFYSGDIAELILWDDVLSDADRRGVEVYLDNKWGLGKGLETEYTDGSLPFTSAEDLGLAGAEIPEPAGLGLLGVGLLALRRRRS